MSTHFNRRLFLSFLGSSVAGAALARAPDTSLRPVARKAGGRKKGVRSADTLVQASGLSGVVTYVVADATNGKVLEDRGANALVPPASVAKVITGLYALETLGPSHKFRTSLYADGKMQGDVLNGDLILVGGGDPTLDSDDLSALARQLKARGIRGVKGRFLVSGTALPQLDLIDPSQPDHVGYNPAVSGLNLNFNRVHFEWRRANGKYSVKMDARTDKIQPAISTSKMQIANRSGPVYGYRSAGGVDQWSVAQSALGGGGSRWLPVRNPEAYAGDVMRTVARSNGVLLPQAQVVKSGAKRQLVAQHASADLQVIVRDMLRFSTNLTAEAVGLAATVSRKGQASTLKVSAREMNQWAASRLGAKLKLVDHSGLGDASRVTAGDMVKALVRARKSGFDRLLKDIPMRNTDYKVVKSHPVNVVAKTGTLNFVSGLGGYVTGPDGQTQAFAIFAADVPLRKRIAKADREAPRGASNWNRSAKKLQQVLLQRWGTLYGG